MEVSLTTYDLDFQKQFIYAQALIPEYWLVNLKEIEVEVYTNCQKKIPLVFTLSLIFGNWEYPLFFKKGKLLMAKGI